MKRQEFIDLISTGQRIQVLVSGNGPDYWEDCDWENVDPREDISKYRLWHLATFRPIKTPEEGIEFLNKRWALIKNDSRSTYPIQCYMKSIGYDSKSNFLFFGEYRHAGDTVQFEISTKGALEHFEVNDGYMMRYPIGIFKEKDK